MQPISHSLPYEKEALPWVGIKLRRPDMAERKWTPEQKQCIEARGGTVLVSAAAGSGRAYMFDGKRCRKSLGLEKLAVGRSGFLPLRGTANSPFTFVV